MKDETLAARLEALNAARYAALATIHRDDSPEAREAKAKVANSIYVEIELAEEELDQLRKK